MRKSVRIILPLLCALLVGCGRDEAPAPVPESTPAPPAVQEYTKPDTTGEGQIRISELAVKNHAGLRSGDGNSYDWIELENVSDGALDLTLWQLSDKEDRTGYVFPETVLEPGAYLVIFASKAEGVPGELHADFALSEGETVFLRNASGYTVASAVCADTAADVSLCLSDDGTYCESLYPTPGYANTGESYDLLQAQLITPSDLIISEVSVDTFPPLLQEDKGYFDWVELKNNSGHDIALSDYYLSDDEDDYFFWQLPEKTLAPGELVIISCPGEKTEDELPEEGIYAPFKLDSTCEQLFLSGKDGLTDFVSLRDIPYRGTYGRIDGENGWFFFETATPGMKNGNGFRRVSRTPVALTADGVFENTDSVTAELSGSGKIYYTLDSTLPTEYSQRYTEPLTLDRTCVLRAIAVEDGCLPSRALTLSYFLNENLTLPALSIVTDDAASFNNIYYQKLKDLEVPANLAFYEDGNSFSIGCGIKMNGATSLALFKKNLSFRFRGSYGQERLSYDIFGGGVTEFSNLLIRSGQDYYSSIIRNEFAQELCLQTTDKVVCQRSRYCVAFLNGAYFGIYALKEKPNEQMYADLAGVSKESVTLEEAHLPRTSEFYNDVWLFCTENDMSLKANYEHFCDLVDVDSLIDWMIMEGYCCNDDLTAGNVRYVRSSENDGKWRFVFFDLDSTFAVPEENFANLISDVSVYVQQISKLIAALLKNEEFTDRFLTRAGYCLNHTLTDENALALIDSLADEIKGEVTRDYARSNMQLYQWENNIYYLREFFIKNNWRQHNIDALCAFFELNDAERIKYFGA